MANKATGKVREIISEEYIQGIINDEGIRELPSMRELSRRHDVTANTISRWARKDSWLKQRQDFQDSLNKKIKAKRVDNMAGKATKFDANCLSAAEEMLQDVTRRLQEHEKALNGDEDAKELAVYHLRELSQTALNSQKLGRLALGEASEIHKGSIDVDGEEHFKRSLERLLQLQNGRAETYSEVH